MPRNLSNGFVFKDERSDHWRAAINWQDEDGSQGGWHATPPSPATSTG